MSALILVCLEFLKEKLVLLDCDDLLLLGSDLVDLNCCRLGLHVLYTLDGDSLLHMLNMLHLLVDDVLEDHL